MLLAAQPSRWWLRRRGFRTWEVELGVASVLACLMLLALMPVSAAAASGGAAAPSPQPYPSSGGIAPAADPPPQASTTTTQPATTRAVVISHRPVAETPARIRPRAQIAAKRASASPVHRAHPPARKLNASPQRTFQFFPALRRELLRDPLYRAFVAPAGHRNGLLLLLSAIALLVLVLASAMLLRLLGRFGNAFSERPAP